MPEIYPYQLDQDHGSRNANYTFTTKANVSYSVSFTEVRLITELFDNYPVLSNGVYFVIEPINPPEKIFFDANTGLTVSTIFEDYMNNTDLNSIIIYNCDEYDGKQEKRHHKFHRWYTDHVNTTQLQKIDKQFFIPKYHPEKGTIYIPSFISIIFGLTHPRYSRILSEIDLAIVLINTGKPDTTI